jgi:tetratricopeptide (TPR) repeat protein
MTTDIYQAPMGAQPVPSQSTTPAGDVGFRPIPTRIQDLAPLVVEAQAGGENKAAVVESLQELGEKLGNVHRTAAEAYLSQGMYEEALPHLEAAATFASDYLEYHNQVGFVRYLTGNDEGAKAAFEYVLSVDPQQFDALFNLGMVLFGQQNWLGAAECFERALALNPSDAETWNNRGAALAQAGSAGDAIACFRQALAIEPGNADATANLQALGV